MSEDQTTTDTEAARVDAGDDWCVGCPDPRWCDLSLRCSADAIREHLTTQTGATNA